MFRPGRVVVALLAAFAPYALLHARASQDAGTQTAAQWRFEAGG